MLRESSLRRGGLINGIFDMCSASDYPFHSVFPRLEERLQSVRERKSGCIVERTVHCVDCLLPNLGCSVSAMKRTVITQERGKLWIIRLLRS